MAVSAKGIYFDIDATTTQPDDLVSYRCFWTSCFWTSLTLVPGDDKIAANVAVRSGGHAAFAPRLWTSSNDHVRVLYGTRAKDVFGQRAEEARG
jgi:hypothetical protein